MTTLGVTGQRTYSTRPVEREFGRDKVFAGVAWYAQHKGVTQLISGMAEGVDQWAAAAALLNHLELFAALPFPEEVQSQRWNDEAKANYHSLLASATGKWVAGESFGIKHYATRNQYIVDNSDEMLVVTNGSRKGGTWNCIGKIAVANRPGVLVHTSRKTVTPFVDGSELAAALGLELSAIVVQAA